MTFQREFGEGLYWPAGTAVALIENLGTCAFFCVWISGRLCFPIDWSAEAKTSLDGQDKVTAPLGKMGVTGRGCSCCRQGRDGGSLDPAPSCYPVPWRIQKKAERGMCWFNAGWVFVLCPRWGTGRDGFAQLLMLIHTHRAALLQHSPLAKGKRGFDSLPANLVANCQCFERLCFAWAVQPFPSNYPWTCSTLLKIVQSVTVSSLNCDPTSSVLFGSPFLWKYSSFPS